MAHRTIRIPGLQTRASFEPSTFDEKANTVEVVFTTGARGKRYSWDGPFYEELEVSAAAVDLTRLNNGAPLLNAHDTYSGCSGVIGVVERAWLVGTEGRALVRFSDRAEVQPIKADVLTGILRHTSVGYSIQKLEKVEEVDDVPVYRATRWTPHEISLVPMGFDDRAVVRGRPEQDFYEVVIEERAMSVKTNTEPGSAAAANATGAQTGNVATTEDATRAAVEAATKNERERVTGIRQAVRAAKLGDELADDLVARGVSLDAARAAVLDKLATRDEQTPTVQHVRIEAGEDARDKFVRGASAWLIERAGATVLIERAAKADPRRFGKIDLDPGEFRGLSLVELARESLERRSFKTRGMSRMDMVGHAFVNRSGVYNTTSDFAVLFENVMHKMLLGAYVLQDDTWSRFCKKDTVPDFRPSARFRTGSFGSLDSLNENGEFKNKPIPDGQKTAISVGTKGNIISLSRQAIINDDMSALADIAQKFGRAAKLSIEVDVYALLTANAGLGPTMSDGNPFFHATRGNINSTGSALSVAGLDADRVVMGSQKDIAANEYIELRPAVLVVPLGLGGEAKVINGAEFDPSDNKLNKPNKVRGLVRDIVDSPRLTGTRRYVFADPSTAAAFVVAFLEGQGEAPVLESENGWRTDGVEWKVRLDFKAQAFDPKGAVTNAGQ